MSLLRTFTAAALAAGPLLGVAAWAPPAAAQPPPPPGTELSGTLPLYGKPVPLPPGAWRVAAAGFAQIRENAPPDPYGAIASVLLERPAPTAGEEKLLVQTNVLPVTGGWGSPPECADPDTLFRYAAASHDLLDACAFVLGLADAQRLHAALPGLTPGSLPWPALLAGFRVSDRRDMLEIRYAFPAHGLDRPATVRRLAAWTQVAQASALAALRQPPGGRPPLPAPATSGDPAPGTIPEADNPGLPIGRLATYPVVSSLATFTIASALTGSLYTGALVTFWQGVTQGALYVANDLAFDWPRHLTPMPVGPVLAAQPPARPAATTAALAPPVIDGKGVPLPGEGWEVVARTVDTESNGTAFARLQDGRLAGLALVHTTARPRAAIFSISGLCTRPGDGFAVIRYDNRLDGFCAYGRMSAEPALDPLWDAAIDALVARQIPPPDGFGTDSYAMVGAQARTREHLLDLLLYVPSAQVESPAALAAWTELVQEPMERGVRGRLAAVSLPWPGQEQTALAALAERPVGQLRALRADGAIGPAALERQTRAAAAALAEGDASHWTASTRAFAKEATYQTLYLADALGVYWIVTGSAEQALIYASINSLVQPVLSFGSRRFWAEPAPEAPGASPQVP
jgi:uncharacterized membrane protein